MISFEDRVRAFNLGMSFQDQYALEIRNFALSVVRSLKSGSALDPSISKMLLTTDPDIISKTMLRWSNAVSSSKLGLRDLLANYHISQAYFLQRTWADGHFRIYGDVLDMYELPNSSALKTPHQVSRKSVEAIRRTFPVDKDSDNPLSGADEVFESQLRSQGNPWIR